MNKFSLTTKTFKYAFTACLLTILAMPSISNAEGFALQDWSARGASLAGGLVTRGGDASTVAYNPAAMTELDGKINLMLGSQIVFPSIEISGNTTLGSFSEKAKSSVSIVPNAYATYKLNDSFSLGLGVFSRFGSANEFDEKWAGSAVVTAVDVFTITANPVIAWRVNDMLSLAGGIELSGSDVTLKNVAPLAPGINAKTTIESTEMAYAAALNFAAHLRINPQWTVGLTYRSPVNYYYDGKITMASPVATLSTKGTTTLKLPQEIEFAVGYKVNEQLDLEAMLGFVGWSSYKNLDLYHDNGIPGLPNPITNPKHWDDTWVFSLSAEYDVLDWLTVRGGISHETSPISSAYAEYIAPSNGRWNFATGAGFKVNNFTADVAYVYHMVNDLDYGRSTISGVHQDSKSETTAHSLGISLGYKF